VGVVVTLVALAMSPAPTRADEATARLFDVEIKRGSTWEEPPLYSPYGQTAYTADVYVDLLVTTVPHQFKLGIYSQVQDIWLVTTIQTVTAAGHIYWRPTITVPPDAQSLAVYVYYLTGSQYVQDDVAFGWTPVHGVEDNDSVGLWGPNQWSLPTVWKSGDFATFQQYFWWWNNSGFPAQTVGTQHQNRLKTWATRSDAWLMIIEYGRLDIPLNRGVTADRR
jgi:hypothetical protein